MQRLDEAAQGGFRYALDPGDEPVASVEPGESVVVETASALRDVDRGDPGGSRVNPLSGPIRVAGAERGDALRVTVDAVRPRGDEAATFVPSWWSHLGSLSSCATMEAFLESDAPNPDATLPIEDGTLRFAGRELPVEPMLGTVATAPAHGPVSHGSAGPTGGNMDLPVVAPGSTLVLPVQVEGGLLYLGDAHARQGEGEVTFVAAEMPAEVELTVEVARGDAPDWPLVETGDCVYAVAAAGPYSTLADAVRLAYVNLAMELVERGFDKWDAWRLCGLCGRLVVGNVHCVAAGMPTRYL